MAVDSGHGNLLQVLSRMLALFTAVVEQDTRADLGRDRVVCLREFLVKHDWTSKMRRVD